MVFSNTWPVQSVEVNFDVFWTWPNSVQEIFGVAKSSPNR